jgi:nicotinic acid phosphoribosyltransferase
MWISFEDREPDRNQDVLVWCGHDECVKLIEDFRSEEASNNWLLWMPCPSPSEAEIEAASESTFRDAD